MNKKDLVREIVERKSEYTMKEVNELLDVIISVIEDTLVKGDKVGITGFGTFEVYERAEREGRNPQTGETMTFAARKVPKFKPGKAFKDAVNA